MHKHLLKLHAARLAGSVLPCALIVSSAQAASLKINTASLPNGTVGTAYSASLSASGGTTPYSWTLTSGQLPAGLSLASAGAISGTPAAAGTTTFTITATDARNRRASASYTIVINKAASSTGLTSSANPSQFGQAVTLTAKISASLATPTGSVQFFDGATSLGVVTLSGAAASLATAMLAGTHSLTASYSGDTNYSGSKSPVLTQTVNKQATTTALQSSLDPSIEGQTVTFSAAVSAGSGTATGNVQFLDGSSVVGAATLATGTAGLMISTLPAGTHSVTASYLGDSGYAGSTSAALIQAVNSSSHSASLAWTASTSANVAGYNVYRGAAQSGPYTKLNPSLIPGTTYTDSAVQAGQIYYYVCTAVDTSGNESAYSNVAQATIPAP